MGMRQLGSITSSIGACVLYVVAVMLVACTADQDDILTSPGSTQTARTTGRFGDVVDVVAPDGRGVRFGSDGRFIGLLEPPL